MIDRRKSYGSISLYKTMIPDEIYHVEWSCSY